MKIANLFVIGFAVVETGGGCKALQSTDVNTDQDYFLITDSNGCDLPDNGRICIGFYHNDEIIDQIHTDNEADALAFINVKIEHWGY